MMCPRCGKLAVHRFHWAPGGWAEPDPDSPYVCPHCGWQSTVNSIRQAISAPIPPSGYVGAPPEVASEAR